MDRIVVSLDHLKSKLSRAYEAYVVFDQVIKVKIIVFINP